MRVLNKKKKKYIEDVTIADFSLCFSVFYILMFLIFIFLFFPRSEPRSWLYTVTERPLGYIFLRVQQSHGTGLMGRWKSPPTGSYKCSRNTEAYARDNILQVNLYHLWNVILHPGLLYYIQETTGNNNQHCSLTIIFFSHTQTYIIYIYTTVLYFVNSFNTNY